MGILRVNAVVKVHPEELGIRNRLCRDNTLLEAAGAKADDDDWTCKEAAMVKVKQNMANKMDFILFVTLCF